MNLVRECDGTRVIADEKIPSVAARTSPLLTLLRHSSPLSNETNPYERHQGDHRCEW